MYRYMMEILSTDNIKMCKNVYETIDKYVLNVYNNMRRTHQ